MFNHHPTASATTTVSHNTSRIVNRNMGTSYGCTLLQSSTIGAGPPGANIGLALLARIALFCSAKMSAGIGGRVGGRMFGLGGQQRAETALHFWILTVPTSGGRLSLVAAWPTLPQRTKAASGDD
jgi:hypothetical protein